MHKNIYHIQETYGESGKKPSFEKAFGEAGLDTSDPRFKIQHHHIPEEGVSVSITDKQADCLRDNGFRVRLHIG